MSWTANAVPVDMKKSSTDWFFVQVLCLPSLSLLPPSSVPLGNFFADKEWHDISADNKTLTFKILGGLDETFTVSSTVTIPESSVDMNWKWTIVSGNKNETLGPNHPALSYTDLTLKDGGTHGAACDAFATFTIQAMKVKSNSFTGYIEIEVSVSATCTI